MAQNLLIIRPIYSNTVKTKKKYTKKQINLMFCFADTTLAYVIREIAKSKTTTKQITFWFGMQNMFVLCLPDIKCSNRDAIGYNVGLYVISGQAYAKTVTTRSATERPFRVK